MKNPRPSRLPRRLLRTVPAVVAAATTLVVRPAQAKTHVPECAADIMGES